MKTPLQELIERLESLKNLRKIANPHFKEGVSQSIDIATELLEKEREIAQEHAKQSKQEEVDHVKDFHTWRLPNEKPQEKVDEAMTKEIFDLATKIRKGKWTRAEIASEVELLFRRNTLLDNGLRKAAEKVVESCKYYELEMISLKFSDAIEELEKAVNQNK